MTDLIAIVERGFERGGRMDSDAELRELADAVESAIAMLDSGEARVAEKTGAGWHVHQWLKKAVLLSFRLKDNTLIEGGYSRFYDKVPLKYADYDAGKFAAEACASCRMQSYVAAPTSRRTSS